jgi:hypothetical protein
MPHITIFLANLRFMLLFIMPPDQIFCGITTDNIAPIAAKYNEIVGNLSLE